MILILLLLSLLFPSISAAGPGPLNPQQVIIVDPSTGNPANVSGNALSTSGGGGGGNVTVLPNTNGSISNSTSVGSGSAVTISKPANAVGFLFEAESGNGANVRWAVGSTATSTVGNLYEPGRDSGYVPMAANISVIAISGTQSVSVQWVLSQ